MYAHAGSQGWLPRSARAGAQGQETGWVPRSLNPAVVGLMVTNAYNQGEALQGVDVCLVTGRPTLAAFAGPPGHVS